MFSAKFSLRSYLLYQMIFSCSLCFRTFQILFYALRPGFVRAQRFSRWHFLNLLVEVIFDYILVSTFGARPLIYLIMSSFFAGSLHPCAGHFIAEHYLWDGMEQETFSYYGPLNILAYNVRLIIIVEFYVLKLNNTLQVGYHNEHHDFPSIAWTRLPALRALAPEFYDNIPSHPSWPMVIVNFIRDKEVGIFARAKRIGKGRMLDFKAEQINSSEYTPVAHDVCSDSDKSE